MKPVLISLDCYTKVPQTGGLETAQMYFSQFWRPEAWGQGVMVEFWWGPSSGLQLVAFSYVEGDLASPLASSYKDANPIDEGSTLMT